MAARFKEFGLKPGGDNGTYFQNVPFFRTRTNTEASSFDVNGVKIGMKGNFTASSPKDAVIEGDVVVLTPGSERARLEDESLVKDKIVLIASEDARSLRRFSSAGALAAFSITKSPISNSTWRVTRSRPAADAATFVSGSLSKAAFDRLLSQLDVVAPAVDSSKPEAYSSARGARKATLTIRVAAEDVQAPNVIAVLPGSDPVLKKEAVFIGSHLDHEGIRQDGQIYYGADDDASGSTGLLAVAKAFSANKLKPKRTVVFMAFCGEEFGLVGSAYQAENMIFPADKVSAELQMDMIGRNEEQKNRQGEWIDKPEDNVTTTHLIGSKRISTELHNIVLDMNRYVGFTFEYDQEDVYGRSDHAMFAAKGIPISFIFSGFHPDYHQATDTPDKINYEKIANTAKLYFLVASTVANAPALMKRDVVGK